MNPDESQAPHLGPPWFADALAQPNEDSETEVDGVVVRSRCWGPLGPGVVLIHGGGAHARWWDHIAPLLASGRRVVAVDLSGHGDSDRRPNYSLSAWAVESLASARAGGITGPPVVIGHSMGGWVALTVAAESGAELSAVVSIDSPLVPGTNLDSGKEERREAGSARYYMTAAEALSHFRMIPHDPWAQPYLVDYVARQSIVRRDAGWTWKFDPLVFQRRRPAPQLLSSIQCRVTLLRAEHGLVTTDIAQGMSAQLRHGSPVITLPLCGHHVMLDQPLSLVVALRSLLTAWDQDAS